MNNPKAQYQQQQRRSCFQVLVEVLGWLQIVASPTLAGLVVGCFVYLVKPGIIGVIIGVAISIAGLSVGIVWATRTWKKKGTVHFISRIMATPELDKKVNEQNDTLT